MDTSRDGVAHVLPATVDMGSGWIKSRTSLTVLKLGKSSLGTGQGCSHRTEEEPVWHPTYLVLVRHQMPGAGSDCLFKLCAGLWIELGFLQETPIWERHCQE